MEMKKLNGNQTLFNKVNGKFYLVVTDEQGKMTLQEQDMETGEVFADSEHRLQMTEANAICFRLVNDPNPKPVPERYTVNNGALTIDGEELEQGELRIRSVLGAIRGYLVLAVEPRTGETDKMDIFTYEPERDSFKKMLRASIPNLTVVETTEDRLVMMYSVVHDEERGEDAKETVSVFDAAGILTIESGRLRGTKLDRPIELSKVKFVTEDIVALPYTSVLKDVTNYDDEDDEYEDETASDVCGDLVESEMGYLIYNIPENRIVENEVTGSEADITVCHLNNGLVYVTSNLIVSNGLRWNTGKAALIPTGATLVDVTTDGDKTTVAFASDDYSVTWITQTRTRDRGNIYTVA